MCFCINKNSLVKASDFFVNLILVNVLVDVMISTEKKKSVSKNILLPVNKA